MLSERIWKQARLVARAALTLALALATALMPVLPPVNAACTVGCAEFAADSITMQHNVEDITTIFNYQYKNKCVDLFNSNASDATKVQSGSPFLNQWRRCDKDEKCPPKLINAGSTMALVPGEGASAKNPKNYTDVTCREECKKKS